MRRGRIAPFTVGQLQVYRTYRGCISGASRPDFLAVAVPSPDKR